MPGALLDSKSIENFLGGQRGVGNLGRLGTHEGIARAWVALEAAMKSSDVIHSLDARDLANRSDELMAQLASIAVQARESGAFFLITAPNDAQARWIYAQMQAAVEGHRLRGNIELGESPTIRLILPTDDA